MLRPFFSGRGNLRGQACWPLLLGLLVFFALGGGAMLPPDRIGWLNRGDLAQSYLGWAFFRASDWGLPLGANPAYGLEFHSSVYYSDSIPLLAILFKLFRSLLPLDFQYFGLWLLACFLLQAWFAWKLLRLFSRDPVVCAVGTMFFLLAPAMLMRLGGHMALVGHWLLLAALYLCLRSERKWQAGCWVALISVAMGVHAYLFVMTAVLWVADLAGRCLEAREAAAADGRGRRRWLVVEGVAVGAAAVLVGWQAGFFMVSGQGMHASGFGYYKMNLLAPLDGSGWSVLKPNLPRAPGEYEGFNYSGAGILFLLAVAAVLLAVRRRFPACREPRRISLAMAALVLCLLAVTFRIGLGAWQWELPLPAGLRDRLLQLSLQSTGRLFWPVAYLAWLGAMAVVVRNVPGRWARGMLGAALLLQVCDLWPGLMHIRAIDLARAEARPPDSLKSVFWEQAAGRYRVVRGVPDAVAAPGWEALAFLARRHGMATDVVQVARIDWKPVAASRWRQQRLLLGGEPDAATLYVLQDEAMASLVRAALVRPQDALFRLDGRYVLAPGWNAPLPAEAVDLRGPGQLADTYRLPFHAGAAAASERLLGEGWRHVGEGEGAEFGLSGARLYLPAEGAAGRALIVRLALACPPLLGLSLHAVFDGRELGNAVADGAGRCRIDLRVPPSGPAHFRLLELRPSTEKPRPPSIRKARFGLLALDVDVADG